LGAALNAASVDIGIIDHGAPRTRFMRFGDHVRTQARNKKGEAPFGAIDQYVVRP
jgi:fumarylacetoacetate (FAA) hydrolase